MNNKPEWLSALGTLLLAALGVYASHHTINSGEVAFPRELLVDTVVCLSLLDVWLVSWLVVYWRRDQKRERIRFAREMGRPVCGCTTEGVIPVIDPTKSDSIHKIYVCPLCGDKTAV